MYLLLTNLSVWPETKLFLTWSLSKSRWFGSSRGEGQLLLMEFLRLDNRLIPRSTKATFVKTCEHQHFHSFGRLCGYKRSDNSTQGSSYYVTWSINIALINIGPIWRMMCWWTWTITYRHRRHIIWILDINCHLFHAINGSLFQN